MRYFDKLQNEIKPGVRVAYNLSSGVALGTVEKIKDGVQDTSSRWIRWHTNPTIYIRPDQPWVKLAAAGGLSKIKVWDFEVDKVVVLDA